MIARKWNQAEHEEGWFLFCVFLAVLIGVPLLAAVSSLLPA